MLADLSHDLRTPLANLQGFIETLALKGEKISVTERKEFMQISLKNLHNLKHLIDQIFELAYLEGSHVTLNKESILLAELLHDIAAKFSFKAQKNNLTISVNTEFQSTYVYADIGKLERVLTNLIENAIRHTHAGGNIEINMLENECDLVVEVKDTGVGIKASELKYIFDARYQASNKENDAQLHAGLGLAICQKLMVLLESHLNVRSELGKGTSFSFHLPKMTP
jgi:signal transduction histidine kinase